MESAGPILLEFGNRAGSYYALVFFGIGFAALGWAVARQIRRRSPAWRGLARITALALFLVPVALVYSSSLNGFYVVRMSDKSLVLVPLAPLPSTTLQLADVKEARAVPAFKTRWRLVIVTRDGKRHESATWYRSPVEEAAGQIRAARARLSD